MTKYLERNNPLAAISKSFQYTFIDVVKFSFSVIKKSQDRIKGAQHYKILHQCSNEMIP